MFDTVVIPLALDTPDLVLVFARDLRVLAARSAPNVTVDAERHYKVVLPGITD